MIGWIDFLNSLGLVGCGSGEDTATNPEAVTNGSSSAEQGKLMVVANGESFVQEGFVTKDDWQVNFDHVYVTLDDVKAYQEAQLEATFHFDHIFGDGDAPADDAIHTGAVGFEPFANLAEGDTLEANSEQLEAQLSQEDYATLTEAIEGLGHVGEGHCRVSQI